jgi:hypothetical protein
MLFITANLGLVSIGVGFAVGWGVGSGVTSFFGRSGEASGVGDT